jgi:L-alanine-DL-glutamate epimerase-like enolase superfamily enzyme
MQRNVDLVRTVREAVGPNVEIMFDCFMGGDATYIIRLLERIRHLPRHRREVGLSACQLLGLRVRAWSLPTVAAGVTS